MKGELLFVDFAAEIEQQIDHVAFDGLLGRVVGLRADLEVVS